MLDVILGSKTAELVFLHLYHYSESYPTAVAKDMKLSLGQVQRQFERFENAGLLISKLMGRTRVYMFNGKSPWANKIKELVAILYDSIPLEEKEKLFHERRRPRRKGKPVIKSVPK